MKNDSRKSIRKIMAFIAYIVCVVFIVSFALNMIRSSNDNKKGMSLFGYWPVIVVTGSMEPTIQINSVNLCKEVTIDELEVGDIAAFRYSNELITHRVIEKTVNSEGETIIHTKGDNNSSADTIDITADMIKGKIVKTWNGTVPIVSKYIIGPGEFNSVAIAQTFIWILVSIGLITLALHWICGFIGTMITVIVKEKSYSKEIDNYIEDIDNLLKYRDTLYELRDKQINKETEKKEFWFNRMARARAVREIRLNSESVKDFNKAMKTVIRLNKFGQMLDRVDHKNNEIAFSANVKNYLNKESEENLKQSDN